MTRRVANRDLSRAFRWQRRFLFLLIGAAVALLCVMIDPVLAASFVFGAALIALLTGALIALSAVCFYVYGGSLATQGHLYAATHVCLIVFLIPLCFIGVFAIPLLTNGDLIRLRDWERENQN